MIEPEIAVLALAVEQARREVINQRHNSHTKLYDAAEEWFNDNREQLIADVRERYAPVISHLIEAKQHQKAKQQREHRKNDA